VRYSAKLLRERRRTERFGGLIGIVASVGSLVEAGLAIQHGVMVVDLGPSRGFLKVPVWIDIPVSLLMLCASVWVVWGSQRGRKES
jgi:hypothetical protein